MIKPTLTIGIPAHNEEANILNLLNNIISQDYRDVRLEKIIVVSDASTDATNLEVKRVKDKRVCLIVNKRRLGCALTQNVILEKCKSDVLVILNADTMPETKQTINSLASKVTVLGFDYVVARALPITEDSFFSKAINMSVLLRTSIFESINKGDNLYLCGGRGRAISKKMYRKLRWSSVVGEDVYSFLYAKYHRFKTYYSRESTICFLSPNTVADHAKQSKRFSFGFAELYPYYTKKFVDKWSKIPPGIMLSQSMHYFMRNPFLFSYYLVLTIWVRFFYRVDVKSIWEPSLSSKRGIRI